MPDTLTKLGLVGAGVRLAFDSAVVQTLAAHGVTFRQVADASPEQMTSLVWRRDEHSPLLQGFLKVTREVAEL